MYVVSWFCVLEVWISGPMVFRDCSGIRDFGLRRGHVRSYLPRAGAGFVSGIAVERLNVIPSPMETQGFETTVSLFLNSGSPPPWVPPMVSMNIGP